MLPSVETVYRQLLIEAHPWCGAADCVWLGKTTQQNPT